MAKSSSSSDNEVYDDSYCSKSCRKNTENLNTKISKLTEELSDCETDLYNYKRGLSQVEARPVPPPPAQSIHPPMPEFVLTSLPVFADNTVTEHTRAIPRETSRSNMSRCVIKFVNESGCPNAIKINNTENTRKPTVKYAEMYRSQRPRGNQRNWNNQKSQQLGNDFVMSNKACFECGSFNHLIRNCDKKKMGSKPW
ncbi:ribonuclease H-like domain-containing protein [Tanacetum coccineum]|uniref:Ribonuclease H-like domain-containing protein n=1 Tax=Tanacetum coccineum TaxID=301880 RepID=A0ABQ5HC81_9ASTR